MKLTPIYKSSKGTEVTMKRTVKVIDVPYVTKKCGMDAT